MKSLPKQDRLRRLVDRCYTWPEEGQTEANLPDPLHAYLGCHVRGLRECGCPVTAAFLDAVRKSLREEDRRFRRKVGKPQPKGDQNER